MAGPSVVLMGQANHRVSGVAQLLLVLLLLTGISTRTLGSAAGHATHDTSVIKKSIEVEVGQKWAGGMKNE